MQDCELLQWTSAHVSLLVLAIPDISLLFLVGVSAVLAGDRLGFLQDASQDSGEEASQQGNSQNGSGQPTASKEEGGGEYEFTGGETQLLRICMDAMHTAGLALIVQGIATGLLGALEF